MLYPGWIKRCALPSSPRCRDGCRDRSRCYQCHLDLTSACGASHPWPWNRSEAQDFILNAVRESLRGMLFHLPCKRYQRLLPSTSGRESHGQICQRDIMGRICSLHVESYLWGNLQLPCCVCRLSCRCFNVLKIGKFTPSSLSRNALSAAVTRQNGQ